MSGKNVKVEKSGQAAVNHVSDDSIQVFSKKLNKFITVPVMNLQNDIDSHRMLVVDEDHIPQLSNRQEG